MEPVQNSSLFQSTIDANSSYVLRSAASWAKVVGIVTILIGLVFFLMAFAIQDQPSSFERGFQESYKGDPSMVRSSSMVGMASFIVSGVIMLIASAFAIGFGNKIGKAIRTNDSATLTSGFASLRNYFAFWGIIMIITLLLVIVGVAGVIMAATR